MKKLIVLVVAVTLVALMAQSASACGHGRLRRGAHRVVGGVGKVARWVLPPYGR